MLQGIAADENGKIRYYVDGKPAYAGLVRDTDGSYYYISGSTMSAITNSTRYISFTNGLVPEGTYSFGADGKMITKVGVVKDTDGNIRYYVNGKPSYAGLVQDTDGSYYYISGSSLTAIVNTTRYITFTNGLLHHRSTVKNYNMCLYSLLYFLLPELSKYFPVQTYNPKEYFSPVRRLHI